ncbi:MULTISPECIES: YqiJ family protein [unclassified Sphingomonas]|uniref:YqiJ family protein n=1 Tax=unclassified Sphingomonas TaxID=196159 RepID=UPI0006F505FB|nr:MULTISPECIES: YqiJ family protein [unclassified Sphingomonas]KQX20238.1 hypothetical protein ASD17_10250 [Sphingomonas sp. Root1294]KQY67488.1 hypothetical protein ASD39_10310 [Sphingomonas sp. Root50]KRB90866.1 hypothetical protein ASE22_11315 [Sphingomonas sp. Root720]
MLELLAAGENLAFVIALGTMVLIGLVEAVGLGSGAFGHDLDLDADGEWLGWLGFGRLPLLMLLVVFLACFGVIGLVGQQLALSHLGTLLPGWVAIPAAGVAALPATGGMARLVGRIMPQDETTAIGIDQLVGLHAEILVGTAAQGSPAKARVRDFHGQAHYVMVEPDSPDARFAEGVEVLLVRRENHVFRAISSDRPPFSQWIDR